MKEELTQTSEAEYKKLRSGAMSPAEAALYLRSGQFPLRTFADVLQSVYPHSDLRDRLTAEFAAGKPKEAEPSVQRRVNNWLSGRNAPTHREDIFRVAFALGLSEEDANLLLGFCTDYGIHYRDGHDVVYAWFLRMGFPYQEARAFYATLPPQPMLTDEPPAGTDHITHELQFDFRHPITQDELRRCYCRNLSKLGFLHLRAYRYFCRYLDQLIHPAAAWGSQEEPTYSLETVMELYLSLNMRPGKKRSQYDVVQRLIRRDWPNSTTLKNIRSRKEDVPRKLLLLLYVITENLFSDDEEYSEYDGFEDRLDDHWLVLNSILYDCGMPAMDLRNPTDWLVMYAIAADEDEPMSERMAQTIDELFKSETIPRTVERTDCSENAVC